MKSSRTRRTDVLVLGGFALVTLLAVAAPANASGGSNCTTANIAEPFVLPDGTQHEAGQLKLCVDGRHSPVSHMHTTYVDGMVVGMHIGRTGTSEGPATAGSYVMFGRGVDGRLRLIGYSRPGTQHMQVFTLRHAAQLSADLQLADRVQEEPIVIAAVTRQHASASR